MSASRQRSRQARSWRATLNQLLPSFGHRNWIVVADAAYPAHSCAGIETVLAGGRHIDVVRAVLDAIARSRHLSATVYTDAELAFLAEADAHGVADYRNNLDKLLSGLPRFALPHDEIIERLDAAAGRFRVLILKTQMCTPYTSVFIELGCGYWSAPAERALRAAIAVSEK